MKVNVFLEQKAAGYRFYYPREKQYQTNKNLPFRISPTSFAINSKTAQQILQLGPVIANFLQATINLYHSSAVVKKMLDAGKPEIFCGNQANYLFYRPDLILTDDGLRLCEIETSVFGLGLSAFLNKQYHALNQDTMVAPSKITNFLKNNLPKNGRVIFSNKTKAYRGQLQYLAEQVIATNKGDWHALHLSDLDFNEDLTEPLAIYRAFYLVEFMIDNKVKNFITNLLKLQKQQHGQLIYPSLFPQLTEKVILSLIWNDQFQNYYYNKIGGQAVNLLQKIIPPTYNLADWQNCIQPLPVTKILDLAKLTRSDRQYVLKVSGFDNRASWSEGTVFLHEQSQKDARRILQKALADTSNLYILQKFTEGAKFSMKYLTDSQDQVQKMKAKVRLTPYYDTKQGKLLTIKATGCEKTDYIHATTASINTAVTVS